MADPNATIEVGEKLTDEQAGALLKKAVERKAAPKEIIADKPELIKEAEKAPEVQKEVKKDEFKAEVEAPKAELPKSRKKAKETVAEFFQPAPKEEKAPDITELQNLLKAEREARQKLEDELKDPVYQVSKAIKEKGKKALDVFKEIKVVDHSKMSDEELYKYELQKHGVTDADEIENELMKFGEQSALARKKEIDSIKKGIDSENENVEKQFLQKINANDADDERLMAQAQREGEEVYNTVMSLVDRPVIDGVIFTKDIAAKILDNIANSRVAIPKKEDGTTDINSLIQREIKAEMFDLIIDTIKETTKAETIHEAYNELEATPDSVTQTSRPPQPIHKVEKGTDEYGKAISDTLTPIR